MYIESWVDSNQVQVNVYWYRQTHVEKKKSKGQNDGWLSSKIDKNLKKESYAGYAGSDDDQDNEARKVEYAKV